MTRCYQFTEQPYPHAWNDHDGSLRVNLPNRKIDPKIAADLFHRYYDEWQLADELGHDIMLNEHHQTATCMSSRASSALGAGAADQDARGCSCSAIRSPTAPIRCARAEELATIDVISRGRLDMGFIKGVP